DEGVGNRVDGDPVAGVLHLEAPDVVVDEQHGHAAGVGVGRDAERQLRLRAARVEVDPQARALAADPAERRLQPPVVQPEPPRQ
ncbi:Os03g0289850, partial [Oryza sativa Japonica Group]